MDVGQFLDCPMFVKVYVKYKECYNGKIKFNMVK